MQTIEKDACSDCFSRFSGTPGIFFLLLILYSLHETFILPLLLGYVFISILGTNHLIESVYN